MTNLPRHFTATAFVVHNGATLLHWHKRVQAWLPPGGHIDPNEDPVQAALREVLEETGLEVRIIQTSELPEVESITQVQPPRTILVEDVYDEKVGKHQHIDMIYFSVLSDETAAINGMPQVPEGWVWVTKEMLENGQSNTTPSGNEEPPPEDVIILGLEAIRAASKEAHDGRTGESGTQSV